MFLTSSAISDVATSAQSLSTGPDDIITPFFEDTGVLDPEELRRERTREVL